MRRGLLGTPQGSLLAQVRFDVCADLHTARHWSIQIFYLSVFHACFCHILLKKISLEAVSSSSSPHNVNPLFDLFGGIWMDMRPQSMLVWIYFIFVAWRCNHIWFRDRGQKAYCLQRPYMVQIMWSHNIVIRTVHLMDHTMGCFRNSQGWKIVTHWSLVSCALNMHIPIWGSIWSMIWITFVWPTFVIPSFVCTPFYYRLAHYKS